VEVDVDMVEEKQADEKEEDEEEEARRVRRRRRTTLIKSNNPHLAGGEILPAQQLGEGQITLVPWCSQQDSCCQSC
jgi:hypothetical protein